MPSKCLYLEAVDLGIDESEKLKLVGVKSADFRTRSLLAVS
jgi:hypothetical protein